MIPKITIPVLIIVVTIFIGTPIFGQLCEASKKRNHSDIEISLEQVVVHKNIKTKTITPKKHTRRRVAIPLPADYKPPIADEKLIIFPETHASKKKQKKLRKKRKKGKKQGCLARAL